MRIGRIFGWGVFVVGGYYLANHMQRERTLAPLLEAFRPAEDTFPEYVPPAVKAGAAVSTPAPSASAFRVLFIGNSLTHTQAMPKMVVQLAQAAGIELQIAQHSPGGYRLVQHASDRRTLDLLRAGDWNVVVLQEQSQSPAFADDQVRREVDPHAMNLAHIARSASPSARVMLYVTPAWQNGDPHNAHIPELATYDGMQNRITSTYRRLAREMDGRVVPAGVAWQTTRRLFPALNLYGDQSHPNREGAYLIACVFFARLFDKSPVGSTFTAGLDPIVAASLQEIAWNTVLRER